MQQKELEQEIDFLLSQALQKCGNSYDAEDLTQETLLAALRYLNSGRTIENMRGWLLTVLNRKFNDKLRQKYRQVTVGIGEDFDIIDENSLPILDETDEYEALRRAVAYLVGIYREVIVRHYMKGQSVEKIAESLGIPRGTVKSRLSYGREQLKKGMEHMEKYNAQSYAPVTLHINYSGGDGIGGEPTSLVAGDLMAQNILWLAYAKPLTVEEISLAIGIPAAYIEPVVKKLTDGELMKQTGNKYYSDLIIYTVEDQERHIPAQKSFVKKHFDSIWAPIEKGLAKLKQQSFYQKCTADRRNAFELYFAFYCLENGIYRSFCEIFKADQHFPDRPNGGRWIAFGYMYEGQLNPMEHYELFAHRWSGQRNTYRTNFAGAKALELRAYGADGFPSYLYNCSDTYTFSADRYLNEYRLLSLLYLLHTGKEPQEAGMDPVYLKAVPHLTKCRVLCEQDGKPALNIPVLQKAEYAVLQDISQEAVNTMVEALRAPLAQFYMGKKQPIPPHLHSVPLQKQYMHAGSAILFATIREAMSRDRLYNGSYDDDSVGVNQPPCPMIMVIEE